MEVKIKKEKKFLINLPIGNWKIDDVEQFIKTNFSLDDCKINFMTSVCMSQETRIREEISNGTTKYFLTTKKQLSIPTHCEENVVEISEKEIKKFLLLAHSNPKTEIFLISKIRLSYYINNFTWEFDFYPKQNLLILEIEFIDEEPVIPEYLSTILTDVSHLKEYKTYEIVKRVSRARKN